MNIVYSIDIAKLRQELDVLPLNNTAYTESITWMDCYTHMCACLKFDRTMETTFHFAQCELTDMLRTEGRLSDLTGSESAQTIPIGRTRELLVLRTSYDSLKVDSEQEAESPSQDQGSNPVANIQGPKGDATAQGSHETLKKLRKDDNLASEVTDLTRTDDEVPQNMLQRTKQPIS